MTVRRTGRTFRRSLRALQLMSEGKTVFFLTLNQAEANRVAGICMDIPSLYNIDCGYTPYSSKITMVNLPGEIRFLGGRRYWDDYDQVFARGLENYVIIADEPPPLNL